DRRSFLLALAIEGFVEMMETTRQIMATSAGAAEKLRQMGIVFVRFAEENPHLIDLMFESELTTPTLDPQLVDYQLSGHRSLRQFIIEAVPGITDSEADLRTIAYWSAIYGFASMRKKGVLYPDGDVLPSLDIVEAIVDRAARSALAA
ncbi:MAG: WHG domain-containing protein, partial [Sphingomonadales bacterium]|nr:WHG domain-containing protein [Sphingomonadales bacterium]